MSEYTSQTETMPRRGDLILPPSSQSKSSASSKRKSMPPPAPVGWLGYLALCVLVIGTFSLLLTSETLWFSHDSVERTPYQSMEQWTEAWTLTSIREEDPITLSTFFAEQVIPLPSAATHRGINLALHLLAAVLFLKVLQALKLPAAFSATAVFALHPSVVQVLFWPGYRTEIVALICILTALYFGIQNRHAKDFGAMLLCSLVAFILHNGSLVIPLIIALCVFYQKPRFQPKNYNHLLPLLCLALFVGVWKHADAGMPHAENSEVVAHWGQSMFFYIKQALLPFEVGLFYPLAQSEGYNVGAQNNILPFVLFIPFYALVALNFRKTWARAVLLGLTTYLLLIIYGLTHHGQFIDGTPALEDHAQYIALPILLALVVCSAGSICRRMGNGGKFLWYLGFAIFLILQITVTSSYAYSVSQRASMWQALSEQWPEAWRPKAALIEFVQEGDSDLLSKTQMIKMLEEVLGKEPKLMDERILLARTYRQNGQHTNAVREYKRVLREFKPGDAFLNEAAEFYDKLGLRWDAKNARERITALEATAPNP